MSFSPVVKGVPFLTSTRTGSVCGCFVTRTLLICVNRALTFWSVLSLLDLNSGVNRKKGSVRKTWTCFSLVQRPKLMSNRGCSLFFLNVYSGWVVILYLCILMERNFSSFYSGISLILRVKTIFLVKVEIYNTYK